MKNKHIVGQMTLLFMAVGFKNETGRAWARLSNGLNSEFFGLTATKEEVDAIKSKYKEGDEVEVEVTMSPFDVRGTSVKIILE